MIGLSCRLFLFCSVLLCACASAAGGNEALIRRLNNRGPIQLSTENPFLAANLFVSRLAEESQVVYGFIEYRGVPPAVEVVSGYFQEPAIHFYYPESREFFILEQYNEAWVVNGPERVPPGLQDRIAELTGALRGSPVLRVYTHPELLLQNGESGFARPGDESFRTAAVRSPASGAPAPADVSGRRQGGSFASVGSESEQRSPAGTADSVLSPNERRIQDVVQRLQTDPSAQGAEITPQGDLVHHVIYPGETLSIIARWYTHDRANSGRIARINDLKNPDHLEIGDSIIVPSYLLKTKTRFSEENLSALLDVSG